MRYLLQLRILGTSLRIFQRQRINEFHNMYYPFSYNVNVDNYPTAMRNSAVNCFCRTQTRDYAKRAQGKMLKGGKQKSAHLTDEEIAEVINITEYRNHLQEVADKLKKDFIERLSLRASIGNIDNIMVKVDDEEYPLHELAQISRKNANLIAINMSDFPEALKPAMQAIINSGSGMNPQQEGTMIYLSIPKLTREHREQMAKNAKALFFKAKDEIRSVQNQFVKEAKRKTDLSEDLIFNVSNQVMSIAEQYIEDAEKMMKTKQKELLGDS